MGPGFDAALGFYFIVEKLGFRVNRINKKDYSQHTRATVLASHIAVEQGFLTSVPRPFFQY